MGEKDDRVKLCLQTSSCQTRFEKLYKKVDPPEDQVHTLEPYSKEGMRAMIGADTRRSSTKCTSFRRYSRRWFEPTRWSK